MTVEISAAVREEKVRLRRIIAPARKGIQGGFRTVRRHFEDDAVVGRAAVIRYTENATVAQSKGCGVGAIRTAGKSVKRLFLGGICSTAKSGCEQAGQKHMRK